MKKISVWVLGVVFTAITLAWNSAAGARMSPPPPTDQFPIIAKIVREDPRFDELIAADARLDVTSVVFF